MAHKQQIQFCKLVRKKFPRHFIGINVVDVGSLDVNGNNRRYFKKCTYTGIDIIPGKNVDLVMPGHLFLRDRVNEYRTIISTECLEHDKLWAHTLQAMYGALKPGGLLLVTAAGDGREEHGTTANHAWCSPGTNDYYKNISSEMFTKVLPSTLFRIYHLDQKKGELQFHGSDFQFYGIKT